MTFYLHTIVSFCSPSEIIVLISFVYVLLHWIRVQFVLIKPSIVFSSTKKKKPYT
jgi:hypothetical protein